MLDPLVPAEVDLRGYEFMPLYGHHLFGSDFNARASDTGWRAALTLWWAAWNQVPASSLPADDRALTKLADFGRDIRSFMKVKEEALHGFVECSDGRLYHRQLSVWAMDAWARRVKERERKAAYRAHRDKGRDRTALSLGHDTGQTTGQGTGQNGDVPAEGKGSEGKGSDSELIKSKAKTRPPNGGHPPDPFPDPPAWLPADVWKSFREHRARLRAPMTANAGRLMLAVLERLRKRGHSPTDLLNEAMVRGWKAPVDPEDRDRQSGPSRTPRTPF